MSGFIEAYAQLVESVAFKNGLEQLNLSIEDATKLFEEEGAEGLVFEILKRSLDKPRATAEPEEITRGMYKRALAHLAWELKGQYKTNPIFQKMGFDSSRYWGQLLGVAEDPRELIGNTPEKDTEED